MNTKFFHMSVTTRRRFKKVMKLHNQQGIVVTSQKELCNIVNDYFDVLFAPNIGNHTPVLNMIQPCITMEDNLTLNKPIIKDELKQALFQMHLDKSRGSESS